MRGFVAALLVASMALLLLGGCTKKTDGLSYGQWTRATSKYGSSNTWASPFQANISTKGREGIDIGQDVEVTLSLYNVTSVPSSQEPPQTLQVVEYAPTVAIFPPSGSIDSPIWQETLPSLSGVLGPGDGYELKYTWRQVDSSGRQVPPGYYYVELKSGSIRYRKEGQEKTQLLEWSMHTSHSEVQINHPEGTTVSGVWKTNRSVTKDGVAVTLKEIETSRNYSLIRLAATSKKSLTRVVDGVQYDFLPYAAISCVRDLECSRGTGSPNGVTVWPFARIGGLCSQMENRVTEGDVVGGR